MSENSAPELGDRIVNLCANGVPFGMRGTVVAIHDQASGCVEVVMDEEFIGGSTLQGMCGNFRGKLVVWNHLLKISAADSKGIVDQIIPAGSGKDAIKQLLENTKEEPDRSMSVSKNTVTSSYETAHGLEQQSVPTLQEEPEEAKAPSSFASAVAASAVAGNRAVTSPSRGPKGAKQGQWMEAKKPDEKGIGFKGLKRGHKSGYDAWRKSIGASASAAGAKKKGSSATSNLKAVLGVGPTASAPSASGRGNASAGLKAVLGVSSAQGQQAPAPQPPRPPAQPTAAEALFAMMMNQPKQAPSVQAPPPPAQQGFNFTYVEEGEEAPVQEPPQGPPQQPPPYPMGIMQAGMVPLGAMPPQHMGGMYPPQPPPPGAPMGYPQPPSAGPPPAAASAVPPKREKKSKAKVKGGAAPIVPAVVASKGRK
jgi:hypothetical protein